MTRTAIDSDNPLYDTRSLRLLHRFSSELQEASNASPLAATILMR